jgi:hypothetical protein
MAVDPQKPRDWYSVVSGSDIRQGDILFDAPIITPLSVDDLDKDSIGEVRVSRQPAIVLSQSCDLVVRRSGKPKVEQVILCPIFTKSEVDSVSKFDARTWEDIRRGYLPRYHLLNECIIRGHEVELRLVDLANVLSLPFSVVQKLCERTKERIRLESPYREHMSQAFARFFMRVGLPVDIPPFETR